MKRSQRRAWARVGIPLRRQQGRLGVAIVEGEEDRNGLAQRRSVVDDEARDFAVGIDRGVLLTLLLIVA